ncbi:fumarate reductase flavoprotein subunit [Helicobacter heilmannii]|uniref:fumarate reductase flavoprotein subunit n=1 Tax=Helicobacter heilmannii TaxID=35817 RepID=UPI0006A04126|nr:fumarate reductase flavoprotein subunit [Helicobacter heilmannii]GMB94416.1 Fumarate reductase flavoprotein subunit FrdA [Helicobacter heilmannii]CRF45150.1 Succinate dehydrogenase flavoprotein subunit [Helicobacter heilmannii]CRF48916.1 Succinate dehydrogenase flavoprotein subunit [Helicobacter heilmannii]CRF51235.1 Succinate dehydrogenase flavoprotein subunit [Helicobacter heilmannii]
MKVVYCDALVVGGGLAGLRASIACRQVGLDVIVLSLVPVRRSHSAAAQGGMQASLGNAKMSEGDNEDLHFLDTVKGSDWGCDQQVARMFVTTAPKAIRELASWGVPWTRIKKGDRPAVINGEHVTITEREDRHGYILSRDFGGTKKWRTCFTADATGHTMLYAVANEALHHKVKIEDRKEMIALIHHGGKCYGAVVRDLITGEITGYVAKGTLLATGGYGRVYKHTTNAVICDGVGIATALETGVAKLGNMEAVQFHPTALVPSGILMTEGCRGDGGILRDKFGRRFMPAYEPEKKELASRDVVSRRILEHIKKGYGANSPYGDHVWLDIAILGRAHVEKNLRDVHDIAHTFAGIDAADDSLETEENMKGMPADEPDFGPGAPKQKGWVPIKPMQHYSMGGLRTDYKGHSHLKGLFCAGEAACWDLHGFNRLGGNSVSEAVVAGMIIGDYFAEYCKGAELDISTHIVEQFIQKSHDHIQELLHNDGKESVYEIRERMREIMDEKVGVFREGHSLEAAVNELEELYKRSKHIHVKNKKTHNNPELEDAYRTQKMLKIALCIAKGALDRTESRGAHTRLDHPKRDDANWLNRTLASWPDPNQTLPTLEYEPLDIMKMELSPDFRGYGAKGNFIPHPLKEQRDAEIKEITERIRAQGGDRYDLQDALMPFDLQPKYKARNVRLDDQGKGE